MNIEDKLTPIPQKENLKMEFSNKELILLLSAIGLKEEYLKDYSIRTGINSDSLQADFSEIRIKIKSRFTNLS